MFAVDQLRFGQRAFKKLEVRIDNPTLYVPASRTEEKPPLHVSGRVVMMNCEEFSFDLLKVEVKGVRQITWYTNAVNPECIRNDDTVLSKESVLFPLPRMDTHQTAYTIRPGNHVWPFCITLGNDIEESIEGLHSNFVRYEVNAWIGCSGIFASSLTASQRFRVLRTSEHDILNSIEDDRTVSSAWEEHLRYYISVPQSPHYWGHPIPVRFEFDKLVEDTQIENIRCRFVETSCFEAKKYGRDLNHRKLTPVAHVEASHKDNSLLGLEHTTNTCGVHRFRINVKLPRTLRECRQSADVSKMHITHGLDVQIQLRNGHGELFTANHHFPYHLDFFPGIAFDDQDNALSIKLPKALSHPGSGFLYKIKCPPPFENHSQDPIYRPGMLTKVDGEQEEVGTESSGISHEPYIILQTTQLPLYLISLKARETHSRPQLSTGEALYQTPTYESALATPESYTDVYDQPPAYMIER